MTFLSRLKVQTTSEASTGVPSANVASLSMKVNSVWSSFTSQLSARFGTSDLLSGASVTSVS